MIDEIKSVRDVWRKMPSEHHARVFLEELIWRGDRHCPHCGSLRSYEIRGESARAGLYQCGERGCRRQFTITTRTPMHATKLDLRIWIAAMFLVLTSSKGISSVVMARILGVNQKTAWKMGHAIRELMDDRDKRLPKIDDIVDVDDAELGGASRSWPVQSRAGTKTRVLLAASVAIICAAIPRSS